MRKLTNKEILKVGQAEAEIMKICGPIIDTTFVKHLPDMTDSDLVNLELHNDYGWKTNECIWGL